MKKTILAAIIILTTAAIAHAAAKLPSFSLPDPQGGMHSSAQLVANGLVVIVTSPTLHDKASQEGWSQTLAAARGSNKGSLILIENMSASAFKGTAADHMKKAWKPGTLPILLEDNTGKTCAAFGVSKDVTKIFVYNNSGDLIYSDAGNPSAASAKVIWGKLAQ